MPKAQLFSEQNQVGSYAALFLTGGREITGRIESITEEYVVLDSGSNQVTIFFEMIGGWTPVIPQILEKAPDSPTTQAAIDVDSYALDPIVFDIFTFKPAIKVPEANFRIEDLESDDSQELVRAKNKYEYAVKIRELSRLHTIIPPLIRLAERTNNPHLFCVCGVLELELGAVSEAEGFLDKSLFQPIPPVFAALAYIEATRNNWTKCASALLTAIYLSLQKDQPFHDLLEGLGRALGQCQEKEMSGIVDVLHVVHNEDQYLARIVCAFAIRERSPDSAALLVQGKIEEARALAPDSPVFSTYKPPSTRKPVDVINNSTGAVRASSQFGYVSAVYMRGWKFFGFIRDEVTGETFYFDTAHVIDDALKNEIWTDKAGQKVDFIAAKSIRPGTKYRMALEVKRSGADVEPKPVPQQKVLTAPSRTAPAYEKARIAESLNNLEEAAKWYEEEIRIKGPYWQSAIMDLSTLLQRQGRTEDALRLLDDNTSKLNRPEGVSNQKITFLMAAKQYIRAADIIRSLVENRDLDRNRRNTLLRQLSYCQYKAGEFDEAVTTLSRLPQDSSIRQFIQRVEQAKKTPVAPESPIALLVDRELSQWTSGISPFARYLLDGFDERYIDERSRARGYYDEKDFSGVEAFFDRIRGKRPGEKGKVLLTLAAMCEKAPEAAGDRSVLDYLRRSLTFLGEAAFSDSAHSDIARCYLTEAAIMSTEHSVLTPLAFLVATYLTDKPSPGSLARQDGNVYLVDSVTRLMRDKEGWQRFEKDFIYYSSLSSGATASLEKAVSKSLSQLSKLLNDKSTLRQQRDAEMERLRRERNFLMTIADYDYSVASSFIDAANQLREQAGTTRFEMDRNRLNVLSSIAKDAAALVNEPDYVERERKFLRLGQETTRFSEEIKREPTKIGVELLLPIVQQMEKKLRDEFEAFVAKSAVQLALSNVLENDYYIPEDNSDVHIRVSVKSAFGGAPIEGLEISAEEADGLRVMESGLSPELFRGGEEREVELTIEPSPEQIEDRAFTLQCIVRYRKRNGELVELGKQALPVRLGSPKDFSPIPNPYKEYAGGRSVDNPNMFVGRQELLSRIVEVVNGDNSGQCFVLYGQKRSGKTSVLKQLKKRLVRPILGAEVSVGALETSVDDPCNNFFQLCLDRVLEVAEDAVGLSKLSWWPQPSDIQNRPLESFRKAIRGLTRELEATGWHSPRIVLLIDEFTYVYEYIVEGVLPPTFMRQWKSLLQMEMFNAVIVGQDSMPKFKQAYPNEFGVTFDDRITYLSRDEAIRLAEEPILMAGRSRYRGRALDRLLQLTAGSPFYMQIFCDRLVRRMNQKQAPFITEADIEMVSSSLTTGVDALPIERFDPLITAAGESVAEAAREKYLTLLSAIARNSDALSGARTADLPAIDKKESMLRDMQERDVIVSDAEGRVKIRVELFQEWLKVHFDFIETEVAA